MYEVIGQSRSTGASATGLKERRRPSQLEAEGPCKDVGLAIAMADRLGAGVIIRRKTYIYVQEAFRQGRTKMILQGSIPISKNLIQ